jgi:hypothetical protein
MNGSCRGETSKEKAKSRAAWFGPKDHLRYRESGGLHRSPNTGPGRKRHTLLTTGSFDKPNPKGCATQFKSRSHPPKSVLAHQDSFIPRFSFGVPCQLMKLNLEFDLPICGVCRTRGP